MKTKTATILLLATFFACTQPTEKAAPTPTPASQPLERKTVTVFTTAENTPHRMAQTETLTFAPFGQPIETQPCVFIDPAKTFQTFLGIGGALTDAAAETFAKLPAERQAELLQAYFNKETGIGYTFSRTNINSCDFSSDMYTYVEDGDKELATFNIAHDERFKIPLIKKAIEVRRKKKSHTTCILAARRWKQSTCRIRLRRLFYKKFLSLCLYRRQTATS